MHIRNFNLILMLIAGTIVAIVGVISNYSLDRLMYTLLLVLVIFYVLGSIIQGVINSIADKAIEEERQKERAQLDDEVKSLNEMNDEKMTDIES